MIHSVRQHEPDTCLRLKLVWTVIFCSMKSEFQHHMICKLCSWPSVSPHSALYSTTISSVLHIWIPHIRIIPSKIFLHCLIAARWWRSARQIKATERTPSVVLTRAPRCRYQTHTITHRKAWQGGHCMHSWNDKFTERRPGGRGDLMCSSGGKRQARGYSNHVLQENVTTDVSPPHLCHTMTFFICLRVSHCPRHLTSCILTCIWCWQTIRLQGRRACKLSRQDSIGFCTVHFWWFRSAFGSWYNRWWHLIMLAVDLYSFIMGSIRVCQSWIQYMFDCFGFITCLAVLRSTHVWLFKGQYVWVSIGTDIMSYHHECIILLSIVSASLFINCTLLQLYTSCDTYSQVTAELE